MNHSPAKTPATNDASNQRGSADLRWTTKPHNPSRPSVLHDRTSSEGRKRATHQLVHVAAYDSRREVLKTR